MTLSKSEDIVLILSERVNCLGLVRIRISTTKFHFFAACKRFYYYLCNIPGGHIWVFHVHSVNRI